MKNEGPVSGSFVFKTCCWGAVHDAGLWSQPWVPVWIRVDTVRPGPTDLLVALVARLGCATRRLLDLLGRLWAIVLKPSRGHLVKSEEVKIAGGFVDPFVGAGIMFLEEGLGGAHALLGQRWVIQLVPKGHTSAMIRDPVVLSLSGFDPGMVVSRNALQLI